MTPEKGPYKKKWVENSDAKAPKYPKSPKSQQGSSIFEVADLSPEYIFGSNTTDGFLGDLNIGDSPGFGGFDETGQIYSPGLY